MSLKRLIQFAAILLIPSLLLGFTLDTDQTATLGPSWTSVSASNASNLGTVTVGAATVGERYCITSLTSSSTAAYTINVLDAGTTVYSVHETANGILDKSVTRDSAICGGFNSAMTLTITNVPGDIGYIGYKRSKP